MSLKVIQMLDIEPIDKSTDKSTVKRDFLKIYHQQGANLNDPD